MKKVLSLVSAFALALSLTSCGGSGLTAMDAADYVQGLLDATYLGVFHQEYLAGVNLTEEEAQTNYENGLEVEYEYFTYYFDISTDDLTEQTHNAIVDLLADIYQQSAYQVKTVSRMDDGFVVEVVVEPIDIIPLVAENYMEAYSADFATNYADVDLAAIGEVEQEAFRLTYENDWATGIVELFRAHLDELGHLEGESILAQFLPNEDGAYCLSDADFSNIDALVLAYSYR